MGNDKNLEGVISNIKDLIKERQFGKALSICDQYEYKNIESVQAEKLFILTKKFRNYNKAYALWNNLKDSNNLNIVLNGIGILLGLEKTEEALEYANNHVFDDIRYIRAKLKILIKLNKKDEILEICTNPKYQDDEIIKNMLNGIELSESSTKDGTYKLLTKLYADNITREEIKESNISFYKQSVLMLAYYERHNIKAGLELVKKLKKEPELFLYRKDYNKIEQRLLSSKKNYFDISFYSVLVDSYVDFDLLNEYRKEENSKSEIPEKLSSVDNVVKDKNAKIIAFNDKKTSNKKTVKYKEVIGNRINTRYNNVNNTNTNNINNQKHTVLIKDVLNTELNEIGKYLYVMMQVPDRRNDAIRAWDNLENMAYKPITDKETLTKLLNIILKIGVEHPEIVDADSNKFVKLLKN